jgi:hypothetical protein
MATTIIDAKGGRTSLGTSPVVMKEVARQKAHVASFEGLTRQHGVLMTEAKALALRTLIAAYDPRIAAIMRACKLTF